MAGFLTITITLDVDDEMRPQDADALASDLEDLCRNNEFVIDIDDVNNELEPEEGDYAE